MSGFGFWSHDIGGFENTAPSHVFKRWLQFGLLSSHSRLHGSKSYRVPWAYDQEAVDVTRYFTKLKCSLMPYLYNTAVQAHELGIPAMRSMVLEFHGDPAVEQLDRQYMLGDSLLVAPIFNEEGDVTYYLPAGQWTHLLTGEVVTGGTWRSETHGFMSLPLFVRENTILAIGAVNDRPDYDFADGVELQLHNLQEGVKASTVVRDVKGNVSLTVEATRNGNSIAVALNGANKPLSLVVKGQGEVAAVEGVAATVEAGRIALEAIGNAQFTIVLK